MNKELLHRITVNPNICFGKPCIRGMRWPVAIVLDLLSSGMSIDEIMNEHPELEKDDFSASLEYAKLLVSGRTFRDVA